jgi:hypothetical protein
MDTTCASFCSHMVYNIRAENICELIYVDVAPQQVNWHILKPPTENTDIGLLDCADIFSIFHYIHLFKITYIQHDDI